MNPTLSKLRAAGFTIGYEGEDLVITPFSKLTPPQVLFLKAHKADILAALKQEHTAAAPEDDDRHYCRQCAHLLNGRCIAQQFRPQDDLPRRCGDYQAIG